MTIDPTLGLRARASLTYIADRWDALRAKLEPGKTGASTIRTAPTSNPPLALYVSDLMHEIETETRSLAHVLMDETDWTPPTSTMPGLLSAVAERYGHWVGGDDEQAALAFCDWAEQAHEKVLGVLDPPERARYIGPCMVANCDGELRLREGDTAGVCANKTCRSPFTLDEYRRWLDQQFAERLMDRSELCAALVMLGLVHTDRVHKRVENWIARGQLVERGGLYSLAEAKALAEKGRPWVRVAT